MAAKPSFELRLRVLNAVHDAPGNTTRERIKSVAEKSFADTLSGHTYRFTWRTISTWLYRHKKNGITTLENKTRSDKDAYRKMQVNQLAEAIHEVLPSLSSNKTGVIPRSVLYRVFLQRGLFTRSQLAPTTFYPKKGTAVAWCAPTIYSMTPPCRNSGCRLPCSLPINCGKPIPSTAPPSNKPMGNGEKRF